MSNRNSVDTAVALDHRAEGLKKDQAVYVKSNGDGNGDYQGNSEGNGTGNGNGNGNTYGPGPNGLSPAQMEKRKAKGDLPDGRHELQDFEAWDSLGFCFPAWKKWSILSVIFIVQCSMNCEWSGLAPCLFVKSLVGVAGRVSRLATGGLDERARPAVLLCCCRWTGSIRHRCAQYQSSCAAVNASIYANGVTFLTEKFSISEQDSQSGPDGLPGVLCVWV
jgi:hypothetical protein